MVFIDAVEHVAIAVQVGTAQGFFVTVEGIPIAIEVQAKADLTHGVEGIPIAIEVAGHAQVRLAGQRDTHAGDVRLRHCGVGVVAILVQIHSAFVDAVDFVTIAVDVAIECDLRDQVARGAIAIKVKGQATFVKTVGIVAVFVGIQAHQHLCHNVHLIGVAIQVYTTGNIADAFGRQGQSTDGGLAITGADAARQTQVFTSDQLQAGAGGECHIQKGQCAAGFQDQGVGTQGAGQAFSDRAFAHSGVAIDGSDHRHAKAEFTAGAVFHPVGGVKELIELNVLRGHQGQATVVHE